MNKTLEMNDSQVNLIDYLYCEADKSKLGKVFRNLFSNAMKFTGKGGRIVATACALIPTRNMTCRRTRARDPSRLTQCSPQLRVLGESSLEPRICLGLRCLMMALDCPRYDTVQK